MLQPKAVVHVSVFLLLFLALLFFNFYFSPVDTPSKLFLHGGAHQNGKDLVIINPGTFQMKLLKKELRIEICPDKCYGKLTFCYDSVDYLPANAPMACRRTKQAGFDIQIDSDNIRLRNRKLIPIKCASNFFNRCQTVLMQYYESNVFNEYIETGRTVVHNGDILFLNVINASPHCPLIIKNANLDESIIPPPGPPPLTWYQTVMDDLVKPYRYGLPLWVCMIYIVFVLLFGFLSLVLIGLCICVKCKKRKMKQVHEVKHYEIPSSLSMKKKSKKDEEVVNVVEEAQPQVVEPAAVTEPEPSIVAPPSPSPTKPSPSLAATSKKSALKKPVESRVKHLPQVQPPALLPDPSSLSAPTTTTATLSTTNGSSSQNTSLLPEHPESINKKVLIETHYASLLRHKCLGENNSAKAREMRLKYPRNIGRQLQHREIKLFTLSGNEMFAEVDKMCRDAEKDLKNHGIKFDEKKGITKMTGSGRSFIQSPKTPDFISYFCFGAEYYEFVMKSDVPSQFSKYSVPLLFTISMMPRIAESNRRKALKWIRRQIPKIRAQYPDAVEREIMAFPVNALESANEMSQSGGVEKLDKLVSMGRMLMEDKTQRDMQEAAENRAAGRIGANARGNKRKLPKLKIKRNAFWI